MRDLDPCSYGSFGEKRSDKFSFNNDQQGTMNPENQIHNRSEFKSDLFLAATYPRMPTSQTLVGSETGSKCGL